jgi:diacylglycerol kinase family enzyme
VVHIDVGRVERLDENGDPNAECLFFDSVGWGMQAEILETRNRDRELVDQIPLVRDLYRDQAVYVGAALNRYLASWVEPTKFSLRLVADDSKRTYTGITDVIINATPIYAANWVLDRSARADDGLFEIVPIQGRRDWLMQMLKGLTQVQEVMSLEEQFDVLGLGYTPGFSAACFELLLERPKRPAVASQVDGEVWLEGRRFRVEAQAGRLPLIVPKGFRPPWAP